MPSHGYDNPYARGLIEGDEDYVPIRRKRPEPGTLGRPWRAHIRKWPRPKRDEWVKRILALFEAERTRRFETGQPGLTFRACEAQVTLDMITEDLNREGVSDA